MPALCPPQADLRLEHATPLSCAEKTFFQDDLSMATHLVAWSACHKFSAFFFILEKF